MRNVLLLISCLMLSAIVACGGSDTPATSATASVSAGTTTGLDVAGTWSVTGKTCGGFPVVTSFPAAIRATENSVQTFEGCAMQEFIACSEGTLNTQTGDMVLCYSDSLSTCTIRCTGVYAAGSAVTLTCNDLPSGTCTITIQK